MKLYLQLGRKIIRNAKHSCVTCCGKRLGNMLWKVPIYISGGLDATGVGRNSSGIHAS